MRAVSEGRISMNETVHQHLDACLDCRACETACPAGVPYGELIEEARALFYPLVKGFQKKERLKKFLLTQILAKPKRLRLLGTLLRFYQKSGLRALVRGSKILNVFPTWMKKGEGVLPDIPTLSKPNRKKTWTPQKPEHRVSLLRGCISSILFPGVEEAAVRLLEAAGYGVTIPETQACCGALLVHGGFKEEAAKLAAQNIKAFSAADSNFIAVTAAGCGATLKEYGRILPEDPAAAEFSAKVSDISQILVKLISKIPLHSLPVRVAYQDACHLAHAQGVRDEPRMLLAAIPDLDLVEIPHSDWCCGSAGIYNLTHPEMADTLLKEKVESILSVKPDVVAVGNPGCALQIQMGLRNAGSSISVVHPIELLYKSLSS